MPRIYVQFSGLNQIGIDCRKVASKVDAIELEFSNTIKALNWNVRCASDIDNTANKISRKLKEQTKVLKAYQKFINDTYDEYVKLDEYNTGANGYSHSLKGAEIQGDAAFRGITETTDAEYAELCYLSYKALKNKKNPCKAFSDEIKCSEYIRNDSSLKNLTADQIHLIDDPSGLQCFILIEEDKAVVVFAGTNGDIGDYLADAKLTVTGTPIQTLEARMVIDILEDHYEEIVVTGHSLGGHLATDVALRNSKVSRCIAYDPPGRYDAPIQNVFNKKNASKLTTYEAIGSAISSVGYETGDVVRLEVEKNGSFLTQNHEIEKIRNKLWEIETQKDRIFCDS